MDYHIGPIGGLPDPPKLCCIPARPLICVLAGLGIIGGIFSIARSPSQSTGIFGVISIFLDVLLFIGAAQNNEKYLHWSLRVVLISLVLSGIQLLIFPVIAASAAASGVIPKYNDTIVFHLIGKVFEGSDQQKQMFMEGIAAGYIVETMVTLVIGAQLLKYVLVNRLWEYAKATEGMLLPTAGDVVIH